MKDISCPLLTSGVIGGRAPFRAVRRNPPLKDSCTALRGGTPRMRLSCLSCQRAMPAYGIAPKRLKRDGLGHLFRASLKWLSGLIRFSRVPPSAVEAQEGRQTGVIRGQEQRGSTKKASSKKNTNASGTCPAVLHRAFWISMRLFLLFISLC